MRISFVNKILIFLFLYVANLQAESIPDVESLQPRHSIVHIILAADGEESTRYVLDSHAIGTLIAPDLVLTTTKVLNSRFPNRKYKIVFSIKNQDGNNIRTEGEVVYSDKKFTLIKLQKNVQELFNYNIKPVYFALEDSYGKRLRWNNKVNPNAGAQPSVESCIRQSRGTQEDLQSQPDTTPSMLSQLSYGGSIWLTGPAVVYDFFSSALSHQSKALTFDELCTAEFENYYSDYNDQQKRRKLVSLNFRKCVIDQDQTMRRTLGLNLSHCGARVLGTLGRPYFYQDPESGEFVIVGLQFDLSISDKNLNETYEQQVVLNGGSSFYTSEPEIKPERAQLMDSLFNEEFKSFLKIQD